MFSSGARSSHLRRAAARRHASLAAMLLVIVLSACSGRGATLDPPATATTSGPNSPLIESPAATEPAPPPPCEFADRPAQATGYDDWARTLLDTTFRLDAGYAPPDLASAGVAGFAEGYLVRRFVLEDLGALREAAEAAGNPVDLIATYRSHEQQADLFQRRVEELGETEALARTARPGHSEHQLGTAVDFRSPGDTDVTQAWASTPQARWLEANAHRFGFIESYPDDKKGITCYGYEPWHYRYFGVDLAADIHASGLTSREYLWFWQETGSRL